MSKLPKENQFIDLSDYGRPFARVIARQLKDSSVTPVQVTIGFIISGGIAIVALLTQHMMIAAIFLILKSILDAADGELARMKETPSYVGRYFDSIADLILNFLLVISICWITDVSLIVALISFICIQLQGTLYNYYYVILRHKLDGDDTSRVFERKVPTAFSGEKQSHVNVLFAIYYSLYNVFDRVIYQLDPSAIKAKIFPNWFMSSVSLLGLGSQLLIISVMLVLGYVDYILPFFVIYSVLIIVLVLIRKGMKE